MKLDRKLLFETKHGIYKDEELNCLYSVAFGKYLKFEKYNNESVYNEKTSISKPNGLFFVPNTEENINLFKEEIIKCLEQKKDDGKDKIDFPAKEEILERLKQENSNIFDILDKRCPFSINKDDGMLKFKVSYTDFSQTNKEYPKMKDCMIMDVETEKLKVFKPQSNCWSDKVLICFKTYIFITQDLDPIIMFQLLDLSKENSKGKKYLTSLIFIDYKQKANIESEFEILDEDESENEAKQDEELDDEIPF